MYRQDLERLISLFQTGCQNVTISDQNNRYDSLDEMKAHVGAKIKELDIRGETPGVHFLLNQKEEVKGSTTTFVYFNELRMEELTDDSETLFLKIKEFLSEYERPNYRAPFVFIGILAFIAIVIFIFRNAHEINGQTVLQGSPWSFIGLLGLLAR